MMEMGHTPFAHGGMREAFHVKINSGCTFVQDGLYVAKRSINLLPGETNVDSLIQTRKKVINNDGNVIQCTSDADKKLVALAHFSLTRCNGDAVVCDLRGSSVKIHLVAAPNALATSEATSWRKHVWIETGIMV